MISHCPHCDVDFEHKTPPPPKKKGIRLVRVFHKSGVKMFEHGPEMVYCCVDIPVERLQEGE